MSPIGSRGIERAIPRSESICLITAIDTSQELPRPETDPSLRSGEGSYVRSFVTLRLKRLSLAVPMSASTAQVLDGTALATSIKASLATRIAQLKQHGVTPGLGTILVGDDPASATYVALKHRDSGEVGIASFGKQL